MRNLVAIAILIVGLRLAAEGHGGMLVAALILALFVAGKSAPKLAGGHYITGHGHGERKLIARHEGGHAVAAKALGGRVRYAWLTNDSGYVAATLPDDDPAKAVAFLAAGRYAVGTGRGCSADDAAIRKELRRVPSKQRAQVKRDGIRLAKWITSSRSGEIHAYARKLDEKGRL